MTLARHSLICSIRKLLVVGNLEAANITMALATDAPMQAKEVGMAPRRAGTRRSCAVARAKSLSGRSHKPSHFRNFTQLIASAFAG